MMLSGWAGWFAAFGCIASPAAIAALPPSGGFIAKSFVAKSFVVESFVVESFVVASFAAMSMAMLLSERFRRGGRLPRLLDLGLIREYRLSIGRRRQQSGKFEQHAIGAVQFGFDKAARIGGGIDKIARCAAARTKTEAIERDQSGLRIAGHRISLARSRAYMDDG